MPVDPWVLPRSAVPAGGLAASLRDVLTFVRLHLAVEDYSTVLPTPVIRSMQAQQGAADAVHGMGLGWFLRTIEGQPLVVHEGAGVGHRSLLVLAPSRQFGLAVLANADRRSILRLADWVLDHYLAVRSPEPTLLELPPNRLLPYCGDYLGLGRHLRIRPLAGGLRLVLTLPERSPHGPVATATTLDVGFEDNDRVLVLDGPDEGVRGEFFRTGGEVTALRLNGRVFVKQPRAE